MKQSFTCFHPDCALQGRNSGKGPAAATHCLVSHHSSSSCAHPTHCAWHRRSFSQCLMLQQMPAHIVGPFVVLGQHDGVKLFLQ